MHRCTISHIDPDSPLRHAAHPGDRLVSINGKRIPVEPQSICVHGDNAEAVATAQALREGLTRAGYRLVTLPELLAGG